MLTPSNASAAFTISSWKLTPSTTQAAGHPNVNFYLDPDAAAGDATGDDLKTVQVDFSAGMLANPEAVTPANRCTSTKFASDTCPSASQIGKITVNYRRNGSYYSMSGTMYELVTDPSSVLSFGFIVRPTGYKKIYLKSSKVTGLATVRTGIDADYGVSAVIDSIPRTITTTGGSVQNVTISKVSVDLQNKTNSSKSGPYFTFNPTRCTVASTRATMTSYLGASTQKTSSYTPTGCSSVPFTPGFSATPSSTVAGAPIGLSATVTVPTASATIQQSHVKSVQTTLPTGTTLNFPNINAVSALCTDAQLSSDSCPAGSQIGTTSVSVPFLPPTMTGGIYLMGRSSSITFGYTLHGSGGTLVVLKGSATAVDLGSDGIPDAVRAYLINLPQAPFSSATLNFTSQLINNPEGPCTSPSTVSAAINGWSGASATKTSSYTLTGCGGPPETNIISIPTSPTADNTPTFTFSADLAGSSFECAIDGAMFSSCLSPYTSAALTDGSHTFLVRAVSSGGTDPTPASTSFIVDTTPPVVTITAPANGAILNSPFTLNFTAIDATNSVSSTTCNLDADAATACASGQFYSGLSQGAHTVVVSAADAAGNTASATVNFTVDSVAPVVAISSPANGSITGSSVTLGFTATDATTSITGRTCKLDAAAAVACTSPQAYSGLSAGSHTIIVTATDQAGNTGSATTTFTVISPPVIIPVLPPSFVNTTTISISFSATNSPTSYTCRLDSLAAAACTSPVTYSGLSQGQHCVTITATNAAGSGTWTYCFTVDSVAPVVSISSPALGSTTGNSVNTVFTATDATTSITGRTCKLDAAAAVACTSPQAYSGLSVGSHTIIVTATDQAGNTGSATTTFTVTAPPIVTISSPASGAFLNSTSVSVAFTTTNSPTSRTCSLDGGAATACTSPASFTSLSQGTHCLVITATNAAGSGSATICFTIDTVAPAVAISSPATGSTTGNSVSTVFTATDATTSITSRTCKLDAAAAVACTSPQAYSGLSAGSHTIVVTATDQAGNTGSATTTFTVASMPVITISSPAQGAFIGSTSISVAFTTTNAPISITCRLDAAPATACSSPYTYSGLSQGAHTVVVTSTNAAGSGSATVTFTVDTVAPAVAISSPANGSTTGNSVNTVFTATDATTSITGRTCKLDAAAAVACTSPQAYSGLSVGSHTIILTATDQAGNTGSATTTFTVCTSCGGSVTISSPANGAFINSTTVSVAFTATGSPTLVTCKLDAAAAVACTSPQVYTGLTQGAHTVVVTATDASGSRSATVSFTVDTVAPMLAISSPANGSTQSTSVSAVFSVTDATTTTATCKLDAAAATSCTSPQAYSGLSVGSHTIIVTATDQAGNTGSATTTFNAVTGLPVVTITAPANGAILNTTSASVAFTVTGSPTLITCKLDAAAAAVCASPQAYSGLSQGAHTVVVTATNATGSGSATVSFTVDTVAPMVAISSPANGSTQGTSVSTVFSVTDATTTTATCKLDAAAAVACTSPQAYSGLSVGSHTIIVTATDQAGNTGSATTTFNAVTGLPVVTITAPANGAVINSTSTSVSFTATGSPTLITCKLDAAAAAVCASPQAYSGLSQGAHTVVVTATNATGSGSATVTFTVVSGAPVVAIASPANGSSVTATPINVAYTVNGGTTIPSGTTCTVNGLPSLSPNTNSVPLVAGANTVTVTCTNAFGSGTSTVTVNFVVASIPSVTITSPADNQALASNYGTVYFSTTGTPTIITCSLDGAPDTNCASSYYYYGLDDGSHNLQITATNSQGTGTASVTFTIDTSAPAIAITSPMDGQILSTNIVPLVFSATDVTTSVTSISCVVDDVTYDACGSPFTPDALSDGVHGFAVIATDLAGNTSANGVSFTVDTSGPGTTPPDTIIIAKPGPAVSSTTPSFSFTGTHTTTGFSCQIDSEPAVECDSGSFTAPPLSDVTVHQFTVAASNVNGVDPTPATTNFMVDSRDFDVSMTVTKESNSLTPTASVSAPAAHPNVSSTFELHGADDVLGTELYLPHGLHISPASIPAADRCTLPDADAGSCPASSIIGTVTAQIIVTDSATPLAAAGTMYMTEYPDLNYTPGIAIKMTAPGGRGDILTRGVMVLIENGTTTQFVLDSVPTATTNDVVFHATSIGFTLNGDTGGAAHPLITNPSYCFAPAASTGFFAPYDELANPNGYFGRFAEIVGAATSVVGMGVSTTVAYTVTGCDDIVPDYTPNASQSLSNPGAGETSALTALVNAPADHSTTQKIVIKEPPKIGWNFSAFGDATDQCPPSSVIGPGAGVGNPAFNNGSCPEQARIGQIEIVSPLFETPIIGDVYLIDMLWPAWLGIHIDPTITYPGRPEDEANPQGVTFDLLGTVVAAPVHPTCSSDNGDADCGVGQPKCDLDTQFCQEQIVITMPVLPDMPLSSATLNIGRLADGTTPPPGRIGTGSIASNDLMTVIGPGDNTCVTGIDPNTPGADTGGGSPFTQSAVSTFTAWSRTSDTGGLLPGTSLVGVSQEMETPGC